MALIDKGPTTIFTKLWLLWTTLGLLTAFGFVAAIELGVDLPRLIWTHWVIPMLAIGGTIELVALMNGTRRDTLSWHVWNMRKTEGGWSLALATTAWLAWFVGTGDGWPSIAVFFLLWMLFHFAFEGKEGQG